MPRVLLIEDDAGVRTALVRTLAEHDFAVSCAGTALGGLEAVTGQRPDLVLLDLGLPDVDGLDVLRMIRAVSQVPVLVATARDDEAGIVVALDCGADDYLVKPFGGPQLVARVKALLRRTSSPTKTAALAVGDLVVDPAARTARLGGGLLDLAPREFDMLAYLAARAGEVITKRDAATLVDVLLDNVFTHTPDTTRAVVSVDGTTLRIDDDGPGMGNAPRTGSTGMGLAIAARIAAAAHGEVTVGRADRLGGTRVEVRLGVEPRP